MTKETEAYKNGTDEGIYARLVESLEARGTMRNSIQTQVRTSKRMWRIIREGLGLTDLSQVDVETIRWLGTQLAGYKETTAKTYMSAFGRLVQANTGWNPYTAIFVRKRRLTLQEQIDRFATGHRFETELRMYAKNMQTRCIKENCIVDDIRNIARALRFLDSQIGPTYTLWTIGLEEFSTLRMALDVSENTCRNYIDDLRRFVRFVTRQDPLRANMMWNNNEENVTRKFITTEEWSKLIKDVEPDMYLILCLGAFMGLRRHEMATLRMDDISDGVMIIRGKGHGPEGKKAIVPIPRAVQRALDVYLPWREEFIRVHGDNSEGHVLIQTRKYQGVPMSDSCIAHKVKKLGKDRGVDMTTHSLRRLYATTLHDAGVDLDTIRRKMRHANMNTTSSCYINADPRRIKAADDELELLLLPSDNDGECPED